jgi:hypothetical protein
MSIRSTVSVRACQPTIGRCGGDSFALDARLWGQCAMRRSAFSIAVLCGLAMAASAQNNADYSATPVFGGNGGGSFEGYCPTKTYLIGIGGRSADWIDAIQPICAHWNAVAQSFNPPVTGPTAGGSGGQPATLMCPAGMVVTGWEIARVSVRNAFMVRYVRPQCETVSASRGGGQIPGQFGGSGTAAPADRMGYKCPQGQFANGIYGASGSYVDRAGLRCEVPDIMGAPVAPERPHVKSLGRVPVPTQPPVDRPARSICEIARDARSRNSPAAPSLEAQCRAQEGDPSNRVARNEPSMGRESRKSEWISMSGPPKCVGTANNGSMVNGTPLVIWDCHGNPDQRWTLTSEHLLENVSNKCVGTADNGSMQNGTRLVMWDCHGNPDQRWMLSSQ